MRRRIRDKMRQASSKTKKKGGRPSKNPQAYESELPKMSDGNKDWLKYPSSAKTELSEVDVDGSTPKYREAIGCDGSRIRSVTPPSQEDALDEQRYGPIIDGIEDGTTYVEARRNCPECPGNSMDQSSTTGTGGLELRGY